MRYTGHVNILSSSEKEKKRCWYAKTASNPSLYLGEPHAKFSFIFFLKNLIEVDSPTFLKNYSQINNIRISDKEAECLPFSNIAILV